MAYELFCKSVQGYAHIKKGIPCEDFGIKKETELCKVFALGDGHGDSNCPRSKKGSQYVCEIASEELVSFANDLAMHDWTDKLFDRAEAELLIGQLITSIFGKWSCKVNDDFEQFPLTEKECEEAAEYIERYRNGERVEHAYGTTFIAGLITDKYLLLLQQGDGRCVVVDQNGDASQPIPWDDRCFANITTSVCDIDAIQSCRYHIVNLAENRIIGCVAGSDGVEDSFNNMDKMHSYYRTLFKYAYDNGVLSLENYLEKTLPLFSENGSGDDTTICGVMDVTLLDGKFDKMERDNQIIDLQNVMLNAQEHIDSMSGKLSFLQRKYDNVFQRYQETESQYSILIEEFDNIKKDISMFENDFDNDADSQEIKPNICNWLIGKKENKNKRFSVASYRCLKQHIVDLQSKIEELGFESITKLKNEAENEYSQYKSKYTEYVEKKADAERQLEELQKQ